MNLLFRAITHRGNKRSTNEDRTWPESPVHPYANSPYGQLFIVADGMGGHGAGDIASGLAVDTIATVYYDPNLPVKDLKTRLEQAIYRAHEVICQHAQADRAGMGTTAVAAVVDESKQILRVAWAGDSRAYRMRDQVLEQLTEDHAVWWEQYKNKQLTWEELHYHPDRSRLNNSLTARRAREDVRVDYKEYSLQPGDQILLCSDGLTREVADAHLNQLLLSQNPEESVGTLIKAALAPKTWRSKDGELEQSPGGEDNISAIVVKVSGRRPPAAAGPAWKIIGLTALLTLLVLFAIGYFWLRLNLAGDSAPTDPAAQTAPASGGGYFLGEVISTATPLMSPAGLTEVVSSPTLPLTVELPEPTSTLANFSTSTPTPTKTPTRPIPSPTATPTPTATLAITPTVKFLEPAQNNTFPHGQKVIVFKWQLNSTCDLPSSLGFELRVWKEGNDPQGVMDAVKDQAAIQCDRGVYTYEVGDLQSAPGAKMAVAGTFFWDVLLVNIDSYDSQQPKPALAQSGTFRLGETISTGGVEPGGNGGGGPQVGEPQ